jgi:hypothetical protein
MGKTGHRILSGTFNNLVSVAENRNRFQVVDYFNSRRNLTRESPAGNSFPFTRQKEVCRLQAF